MAMIAKPGFYGGKFLKAGQSYDGPENGAAADNPAAADLDRMTKDDLLAEAERRGVDVKSSDTKAEIIKAMDA